MKNSRPIDPYLEQIAEKLKTHNNLIISAEPGTGKTTRIPAYLTKFLTKKILVLEPRRIAAVSAASHVADENDWNLGYEVGYQVRFDNRAHDNTKLIFMTEALLAKKIQADPELSDVELVVLDEFHERSIHTDLALGLLVEMQQLTRPDLKIIVMSATLDSAQLQQHLGDNYVFQIPGVSNPLTVDYINQAQLLRTDMNFIHRVAENILSVWKKSNLSQGHILVFLPGISEIERTAQELAKSISAEQIKSLHGLISLEQQKSILKSQQQRQIILATNIAESSITIDGVDAVIDSGLFRLQKWDYKTNTSKLETTRISKSSATQRAGRSARQKAGYCLRLWSKMEEVSFVEFDPPEVLRTPMDESVLLLTSLGVKNIKSFSWLTPPQDFSLERAENELLLISAIDEQHNITELGRKILTLPLRPRLAKLFLHCKKLGYESFGAKICAILSEREFLKNPSHSDNESDLVDRLEQFQRLPMGNRIVSQLISDKAANKMPSEEDIAQILWEVFPDALARRRNPTGKESQLIQGKGCILHDNSQVKKSKYFFALQLQLQPLKNDPIVFWAHGITDSFVEQKLKPLAQPNKQINFDKETLTFWTMEALALQSFFLEVPRKRQSTAEEVEKILPEKIQENWDWFLQQNKGFYSWWNRYLYFCKEENHEHFSEEQIRSALEQICYGENSVKAILEKDLVYYFEQLLEPQYLLQLNSNYPKSILLPSGRSHFVDYSTAAPQIQVKLQELFGLQENYRIGKNKSNLTFVLLSPNGTPMQITQDILSFWKSAYFEVRAELRSRYPKHPWPDDPLTAVATHRTKKQIR